MTITKEEFETYLMSINCINYGYLKETPPITSPDAFSINSGWYGLVKQLIEELIELGWNQEIVQCKEKFGGLRFYINEGSDEIYNTISKYEELSYKTCEYCGDEGITINKKGWLITCCDKHSI